MSKYDKVIFLDIDGVLNSEVSYEAGSYRECKTFDDSVENHVRKNFWAKMISERHLNLLNTIVDETGATVVLTSTWRKGHSIEGINTLMQARGAKFKVEAYTEVLGGLRGNEIKKFIDDNNVGLYCILDDDNDMLDEQRPFFVRTCYYSGLTFSDMDKCVGILGYKQDYDLKKLNKLALKGSIQQKYQDILQLQRSMELQQEIINRL